MTYNSEREGTTDATANTKKEAAGIEVLRIANVLGALRVIGQGKSKNNRNNPLWGRYSNRDIKNAKTWGDIFSHSDKTYEDDGTTHFQSQERPWEPTNTFSLRELRRIANESFRLASLIPGGFEMKITVTCAACGAKSANTWMIDDLTKSQGSPLMPFPCGCQKSYNSHSELTAINKVSSLSPQKPQKGGSKGWRKDAAARARHRRK